MQTPQISATPGTDENIEPNRTQQVISALREDWARYLAIFAFGLATVVTLGYFTGNVWVLAGPFIALLAFGIGSQAVSKKRTGDVQNAVEMLEERLAIEASSSRILSGIKLLHGSDSMSPDARLASAVRMATEYPAAVVFNLRDAHGVLAPSNWSFDGQLSHIRDEFEPVDGDAPGAIAARQGSAVVMSVASAKNGCLPMPSWAEQAGFTQGIVAPVSRGLDTIGVVYVLNKSDQLPSLKEIEQLELMISFGSVGVSSSSVSGSGNVATQKQPFRVVERAASTGAVQVNSSAASPIRMTGFALNPEFERMEMDGTLISLSPTEFLLMHTLASSPDKPVSPDELMDRCWTKDSRPADNAVDVAIFRLRKKLNKTASGKGMIKTVRGNGYMFVPPAASGQPVLAD
jgi:DNA-binding winged helix-turn-helix (wHTH) protein